MYTFHSCVCICSSQTNTVDKAYEFMDRMIFIVHIIQLSPLIRCGKRIFQYDCLMLVMRYSCVPDSHWVKHCERIIHFSWKSSRLRMWKMVSTVQVNIVDYPEFVCSIFHISFHFAFSFWCLLCVLTWICLIVLPLRFSFPSIFSPQPINLMNSQQKQITFTFYPLKCLKSWMNE